MSNPYQSFSGDSGNQFGGAGGYGGYDYHDTAGYGYQQPGNYGYQQSGSYGERQPGAWAGNPPGGAPAQPIDAMDIVGQSFKGYLKQPVPGMLAMLVHFIITFALLLVPSTVVGGIFAAMEESGTDIEPLVPTLGIPLMVVMGLVAFAYLFWLMANLFNGSRKIADGEKVTFRDYFRFAQLSGCAGVEACFFILVMIGTVAGGFPGIILYALLWPAPAIKADNPDKAARRLLPGGYQPGHGKSRAVAALYLGLLPHRELASLYSYSRLPCCLSDLGAGNAPLHASDAAPPCSAVGIRQQCSTEAPERRRRCRT